MPVVACGQPIGHESELAYVAADDRDGARQMAGYLRSLGRSRIATIAGPLDTPGGSQRLAGYRDALGEAAVPELIDAGDYTEHSGTTAMELLSVPRARPGRRVRCLRPDGQGRHAGAGAGRPTGARRRRGRRLPCCRHDHPRADHDPGAWQRISSEMARLLLGLIDGDPPSAVILRTELIRRGSA